MTQMTVTFNLEEVVREVHNNARLRRDRGLMKKNPDGQGANPDDYISGAIVVLHALTRENPPTGKLSPAVPPHWITGTLFGKFWELSDEYDKGDEKDAQPA